jgi:rhodanese-related sulfurtransferase
MTPFPLNLDALIGQIPTYAVYLVIGIAFGWVLEMAGFGISTKLAAQFYFKEMTVLKVMFTGIVVAMLLVFLATGLGLLDYNLIWVNPTYMWPGIVGGLIMGVGFIVGGFCPGTSLVSLATGKIDGLFFALGTFFGIFLFGETVPLFEDFFNSSFMGRFTLMELFNTSTGVIVLGVVIMAIAAFAFAELAERKIGKMSKKTFPRWRYGAAGGAVMLAAGVALIGQPTTEMRWSWLEPDLQPKLEERVYQIEPLELLEVMQDTAINLVLLDVRPEADYNRFHLRDARHLPLDAVGVSIDALQAEPANTVYVTISNDEQAATEAWKILAAESVPNIYILSGGVNGWLAFFGDESVTISATSTASADDALHYTFPAALGDRHMAADPNADLYAGIEYTKKVQPVVVRGAKSGGCG